MAVMVCLLGAGACDRASEPEKPAAAATPTTTAPVSRPAPDTKALESAPGSTPPLADAVAPATAPLPDLDGTPGPSPAAGRLDAPVRVYVFTDYQCPVCRRALEPLKLLVRSRPDDVVLVVKQAPSPRHTYAADAAAAVLAAFRQGKFWAYQDALYADQRALARSELVATARRSGLDVEAFSRDLDGEAVQAQVRYEAALAGSLGLDATPSLVINGHVQRGWGSYRGLEALVERELARARTIAAEGVEATRVAYEATRRAGADGERLAAALFEPAS
ncbi:MAG TPA: thioredoxin domain-containing protein [Candidatus Limnocylindria bacterium]|nr:thioredoxin domain-containing protein [Candidatus Limnocylindria bacterium]